MIKRYQTKGLSRILSQEYKFHVWLDVERVVAEVEEAEHIIPKGLSRKLRNVKVTPERIDEIEKITNHDVIAFLEAVREKVAKDGRWLHFGMTSYDLVDTAFVLIILQATDIILGDINRLCRQLHRLRVRYKDSPEIGRTHGVFAQPITFGYKVASWSEETVRNYKRILNAKKNISYGKLSGAVGTYTILPPRIEKKVMRKLGLKPEPVSTQVLPRDRFGELAAAYTLYACGLERIATELRNLSRSEIGEVSEPFTKGQKGSSAMPHKKNPIICERVCGLVKVIRGYMFSSLENVSLWHERDLTNSSVERVIFPDMLHLVHYITEKMLYVIKNLQVFPDRMRENIEMSQGVYASQRLMNALIEKGMERVRAYSIVQKASFKAVQTRTHLKVVAKSDRRVTRYLSPQELDRIFDIKWFLRHIRAKKI
ncbi:MAG: adenylosuccinate lyase [candidate division WOR-3 bacterium]|nr:MAG: adenylosuccinate lyase [candidate division WOR-3 bacterium]